MSYWRNLAHDWAFIAIVVVGMSGCTEWRTTSGPSREILTDLGDRRVRVTLRDSGQIVMHSPRIIGDSVVGYEGAGGKGERRAVAVAEVMQVETRTTDAGKTLGAIGLVALGGVVAWFAFLLSMEPAHT